MFLDHCWVICGVIRNDPSREAEQLCYLYPEIVINPTNPTCATALELDKSVMGCASTHSTVNISVGSGTAHEEGSPQETEEFVLPQTPSGV